MYPSSTPPLDRGHCPRHFAGVEEGFTKWEEVLLIVNICRLSLVQFKGPELVGDEACSKRKTSDLAFLAFGRKAGRVSH